MKILIVDNSLKVRVMLKNTLILLGYKDILSARDGLDALIKLSENKVDLVITDGSLPIMNGFDLVKYLRYIDSYRFTPIVILTNSCSNYEINLALRYRINSIIIKPFSFLTIKNKICHLIPVEFEL